MIKNTGNLFGKFQFSKGISVGQINKLIEYSASDNLVLKFTSDSERFKNKHAFDKWNKKGRVIYTLLDASDQLLGIIWFGKKKMPLGRVLIENVERTHFGMTFAIRLYGIARGKGLSTLFMKKAYSDYIKSEMFKNAPDQGFWLEAYAHNTPAIRTYISFGFKNISTPDADNKIIMVLNSDK